MFYRVDYVVAVILAGLVVGVLLNRQAEKITSCRLARAYYQFVVVLLAVRTTTFVYSLITSNGSRRYAVFGLLGDLLPFSFGVLLGLAIRRNDTRKLLTHPSTLGAMSLAISLTFVMAGIGKAFTLAPMAEFFAQSGYSAAFLKFITIAEILGAIGLLLPWAVVPALLGLTVDMFGAVLTHVHNGDPLNDSTGAIALLIRLFVFALLWTLRPRNEESSLTMRTALFRVMAATVACLFIAYSGSLAVRHLSPPAATNGSPAVSR